MDWKVPVLTSVADPNPNPDPHGFGPPGYGSGSISQRYESGSGSGSFNHQAKKVSDFVTSLLLFIFENDVHVPSKRKKKKTF
jgi:hypothetical protein